MVVSSNHASLLVSIMLLSTNCRTLLERIGAGDLVGVSNMLLDKPPLRKTRFDEVWQTTFCRKLGGLPLL
jgi:hypothetical protein